MSCCGCGGTTGPPGPPGPSGSGSGSGSGGGVPLDCGGLPPGTLYPSVLHLTLQGGVQCACLNRTVLRLDYAGSNAWLSSGWRNQSDPFAWDATECECKCPLLPAGAGPTRLAASFACGTGTHLWTLRFGRWHFPYTNQGCFFISLDGDGIRADLVSADPWLWSADLFAQGIHCLANDTGDDPSPLVNCDNPFGLMHGALITE